MKHWLALLHALIAIWPSVAQADSHALIMTIEAYHGGAKPLEGSRHDIRSARAIARKMGVSDRNMLMYRDEQLTVEGIDKAFDTLFSRISENDQVFIYYSGHGGRARIDDEGGGRCAAAIVAVDSNWFMDEDIQKKLDRLKAKASKIVMMSDACYSGGVKTRALNASFPPGMTPRFHAKDSGDACETPINIIEKNLQSQTRTIGSGGNNLVYIAAAREDEVSWDMGATGGAATQAWRDCILGAAVDTDQSGGLSAAEIQQCAQAKMNAAIKPFEKIGLLPSHVTVWGNASAVLAFTERPPLPTQSVAALPPASFTAALPPAAPGPDSAVVLQQVASVVANPEPLRPPVPSATVPAIAAPALPSATANPAPAITEQPPQAALPPAYFTLLDIYNNRDDRREVTLESAKAGFKIGRDLITFNLSSTHSGFVYILMVGSDGKTFDMLFPNKFDAQNALRAGDRLSLPRPSWRIKSGGPAGKNYLLAIVTDSPRDFSKLGFKSAGPFAIVDANLSTAREIQRLSANSPGTAHDECLDGEKRKRNLIAQQRCSSAYGAAMAVIDEVN